MNRHLEWASEAEDRLRQILREKEQEHERELGMREKRIKELERRLRKMSKALKEYRSRPTVVRKAMP